jgi:pimeloyl-ACP methyl ester carboxylesterase
MSLGALALAAALGHLYLHLGLMLALYTVPVDRFAAGAGYRFWPAGWPARAETLLFAAAEFWALYFFVVTYPLGWVLPRRAVLPPQPEREDPRNVPVVLLHGYMMNRFCMAPLRLYLRLQGFRRLYSLNLRRLFGPIEGFAAQLRDALDEVEAENPGSGAVLVAHSMGGLVSVQALEDKINARRIRGVVAIGSPFGGTVLYGVAPGLCARQFRPNGPFLRRLARTLQDSARQRLVSIYSDGDRMILPPRSSNVAGALATERLRRLGHMSLLLSPQVFRFVRDHLLGRRGVSFEAGASDLQGAAG